MGKECGNSAGKLARQSFHVRRNAFGREQQQLHTPAPCCQTSGQRFLDVSSKQCKGPVRRTRQASATFRSIVIPKGPLQQLGQTFFFLSVSCLAPFAELPESSSRQPQSDYRRNMGNADIPEPALPPPVTSVTEITSVTSVPRRGISASWKVRLYNSAVLTMSRLGQRTVEHARTAQLARTCVLGAACHQHM